MKKSLSKFLIISIGLFCFQTIQAQNVKNVIVDSSKIKYENKRNTESEFTLPPLETVIDSVLKKNAMMRFNNKEIEVKKVTLESERIYWMRNLGFQGEGKYGTLNNFSENSATVNSAYTTVEKQFNYSVGFYVKFPLFDAVNRKNQTKIAELQLDEAKALAESQENQLRQIVIAKYQDLILKKKLLSIKAQTLGNAKVNMEMIEQEFINGGTTVSEYVRISDITSRIESEYEVTKSEYLLAKKLIEDLAGFSFDSEHLN